VRPLSWAKFSIGSGLECLCWKWNSYPRVVFRKSRLVWVLFYIYICIYMRSLLLAESCGKALFCGRSFQTVEVRLGVSEYKASTQLLISWSQCIIIASYSKGNWLSRDITPLDSCLCSSTFCRRAILTSRAVAECRKPGLKHFTKIGTPELVFLCSSVYRASCVSEDFTDPE
jgi:hypothetical protein